MNPYLQIVVTVLCSGLVQVGIGIAFVAAMRQQLTDLVGWVKALAADVKDLAKNQKDHEGRLSHVEGRLGVPRN